MAKTNAIKKERGSLPGGRAFFVPAGSHLEVLDMADEKLSYTIMVDPAGLDWEKTMPGLIFAVQNWAKMLAHMNPDDPDNDSLEDLLRVSGPH